MREVSAIALPFDDDREARADFPALALTRYFWRGNFV
jgi:hypothetical protein